MILKSLDLIMKKLKSLAAVIAAITFAAVTATAVTPAIIKRTDTKACERWVDSVYRSMSDRQRVAQLVFPKVVPTHGANSRAVIKRLTYSAQYNSGCKKTPARRFSACPSST